MFNTYKIWSKNISTRNLVLLFFTIVFGFASVITLANVDIVSDIENARQTIGRVTITSDWTNDGIRYFDVNYSWDGRTFINTNALISQSSFSWKVLGIDDEGNLIYVASTNLVVSWAGGWVWWDGYRTGYGNDIWNVNLGGKVGIWTDTPIGKLHITSSWETDVYIEEKAYGKAANLNLKNIIRSRAIGWDSNPDIFYIWLPNGPIYFTVTPLWYVGIWSWNITPKANLQVVGTFIAGNSNNTITTGVVSSIAWGNNNGINGSESFIWWGYYNHINGIESAILWGQSNTVVGNQSTVWWWWVNTITGENCFLWWWMWNAIKWNFSFIGGGQSNTINWVDYANIVGGQSNHIYWGTNTFIGGWSNNSISWNSSNSFIGWWYSNHITNALNSFAWGMQAYALHNNTFVWNGGASQFASARTGTFIINVPFSTRPDMWGVGINTNDPQALLDVNGTSIIRGNLTVTGNIIWNQNITIDGELVAKDIEVDQRSSTVSVGTSCGSENPGTIIYDGVGFYGCTANNTRKRLDN